MEEAFTQDQNKDGKKERKSVNYINMKRKKTSLEGLVIPFSSPTFNQEFMVNQGADM